MAEAVVPTVAFAVLQALIAEARFVAKLVGLALVTNVPTVDPVQVAEPFEPLVGAAQENVLSPPATEKVVKVPGVVSVTVTVLVLWATLKPTAAAHRPMAVETFVARFVVLESVAKVPVKVGAEPLHAADPALPPVTAPHAKIPVAFA